MADRQVFQTPTPLRRKEDAADADMLASRNARRIKRADCTTVEPEPEPGYVSEGKNTHNANSFTDKDKMSPSSSKGLLSWDEDVDDANSVIEEEDGRGGSGKALRRDRRKTVELTTPTLVDEIDYDDDGEMITLDSEKSRGIKESSTFDNRGRKDDESDLRRTPGATMYGSLERRQRIAAHRRTPGASAMHRSAVSDDQVSEKNDKSILGFGLKLSTPVTSKLSPTKQKTYVVRDDDSISSSSSSARRSDLQDDDQSASPRVGQRARPPRPPNGIPNSRNTQDQEMRHPYSTPAGWTLAKNPNLQVTHGAFSPNTIELTKSLDNILNDDDEHQEAMFQEENDNDLEKKHSPSSSSPKVVMFKTTAEEDAEDESWTNSYIFDNDGGDAIMQKATPNKNASSKNRRGGGSGRRGKNSGKFSSNQPSEQHGEVIFHPQQPKPVRHMGGIPFLGNHPSNYVVANDGSYVHENGDSFTASPQPINFGGAFAPPSKDKDVRLPFASSDRGPSYEASVQAAAPSAPQTKPCTESASPATESEQTHAQTDHQPTVVVHHNHHHHYSPFENSHLAGHPPPFVQGMVPSGQMPFHPHPPPPPPGAVEYHNPMYGFQPGHGAMGHPTQSITPFSMDPSMGQFQGHVPPQQFPPQPNWPQMMQAPHYDGAIVHNEGGWHPNGGNIGWGAQVNEFGYRMFPQTASQRVAMSPSPPVVPIYNKNDTNMSMSQIPFSNYSGGGNIMNSPRAGLRSSDSSSPATVPPGRGRMHSWDSRESQQQRHKTSSSRRQQQKGQTKLNKAVDDLDEKTTQKLNSPTRRKKQTTFRAASPSGNTTSSRAKKKDGALQESEPTDPRQAELVESPTTKSAFKVFQRSFREKSSSSVQEAEEFAHQSIEDGSVPTQVHWRVFLELADLAKRSNRFDKARTLYQQVCKLQPYAYQGWLEYSKLEEECGHLKTCAKILRNGLEYCKFCENLLTRAIKHEEKLENLGGARQLLARLKHVSIDKVWKIVLEGALLEARAGNAMMARRVLKYLMHHVPWYGPLYLEAYRLERDLGRPLEALEIVERGLKAIPRYGPLWFGAFRLCEALDIDEMEYEIPRTSEMLDRATKSISRELMWKVHLHAAQILERAAIDLTNAKPGTKLNKELTLCRERFGMTVLTCPPNLCWKVWLAGGRMELSAGNTEQARKLFLRAHNVVPEKGRAAVIMECARLEEFVGETEVARAVLRKARSEVGSDWKVWLESVLLEIRSGEQRRAIDVAKQALEIHSGTGRLWASLVQLQHLEGDNAQCSSLRRALRVVPKSGEVWCEGARIHLNPFSSMFDLEKARSHLYFATKFTPQYGDSFLESLKFELLEKWIAPIATVLWDALHVQMLNQLPNEQSNGDEYDKFIVHCVHKALGCIARTDVTTDTKASSTSPSIDREMARTLREQLELQESHRIFDATELELRCANADPNYGFFVVSLP
mmetsp:Transcript_14831/g.20940  ORF Transcript_14831/g.20940 Transcript_14831/m.20940 type:complete len:1454 (+) Transcript_14831:187-4548(+)